MLLRQGQHYLSRTLLSSGGITSRCSSAASWQSALEVSLRRNSGASASTSVPQRCWFSEAVVRQHQHRGVHTAAQPAGSAASEGAADLEAGVGTLQRQVASLEAHLHQVRAVQDVPAVRARLAALEHDAGAEDMWADAGRATAVMAQAAALRSDLEVVGRYQSQLEEAQFALEMLNAGGSSAEEQSDILREALATIADVERDIEVWEVMRLLSGPYDDRAAIVTINAGAGGVDAMDWAEMLERMYTRWAGSHGRGVRVLDRAAGDEAGIKSVELEISGLSAYGWLRGEKGTHRLVRSSPFNAKGLRQTSFAGVEVMPVLGDMHVSLDIPDRDLEVSFMRCGGKGGQNVNKVETGVRLQHTPTGLSVKCTQERSQAQNRAIALDMLKAKLLVVLLEQKAAAVAEIRGDMVRADWGQQVRNYVLHPYKLVKDTRTGVETHDTQGVLDGGLDDLMTAFLRAEGRKASQADLELALPSDASNLA